MGRCPCPPTRRIAGIDNHRGPPCGQPQKPHRKARARHSANARGRQRMVQPPLHSAPAAVKPGQRAIGMAQAAQGWGDPLNRGQMRGWHGFSGLSQRLRGPCQKRKDLQQFFGIAGGDAALCVDLSLTFAGKGGDGGDHDLLHAGQRKPRIDQPRQRLEPGQTGGGSLPAPRQKERLGRKRAEIGLRFFGFPPVHQEDGMVDPADQTTPRQVRRPTRPAPLAKQRNPAPRPILRAFAGHDVAHGGQIIEPGKAMRFFPEGRVFGCDMPKWFARCFDQMPGQHDIARHKLLAARIKPDAARFGLRNESPCGWRPRGTPRSPSVRPARHASREPVIPGSCHLASLSLPKIPAPRFRVFCGRP